MELIDLAKLVGKQALEIQIRSNSLENHLLYGLWRSDVRFSFLFSKYFYHLNHFSIPIASQFLFTLITSVSDA